jgi:transposase
MKAYSLDLRERAIGLLQEGMTCPATAERLSLSLSTVKRYKRTWKAHLSLTPKTSTGRKPNIKAEQQAEFADLIASRTDWTLDALGDAWKEKYGIKPTVSVLSSTCKRLKITRKKSPVPPARETR